MIVKMNDFNVMSLCEQNNNRGKLSMNQKNKKKRPQYLLFMF